MDKKKIEINLDEPIGVPKKGRNIAEVFGDLSMYSAEELKNFETGKISVKDMIDEEE